MYPVAEYFSKRTSILKATTQAYVRVGGKF